MENSLNRQDLILHCNHSTDVFSPLCRQSTARRGSHRALKVHSSIATTLTKDAEKLATGQKSEHFTQADFRKFIRGYQTQHKECAFEVPPERITGQLPADLRGTLLRNGPGVFEVGSMALSQPLDGDGLVNLICFGDGEVVFKSRFVRTEAFCQEQEAGKALYRGAFSVGNPQGGKFFNPFDLKVKGIANTHVCFWGNKLLALYERDLPYELDADLKTLGQATLNTGLEKSKGAPYFGAHHRVMQEPDGSQRLVAFNAAEGANKGLLNFWEYSEDFELLHKTPVEIPGATFGFFHDFLVTEHFYIVLENPISINLGTLLGKYVFAKACIAECLEFDQAKPSRMHLIRRPGRAGPQNGAGGLGPVRIFDLPPFFCFHHINAYELPGGEVTVDTVAMLGGINFGNSFDSPLEHVFGGEAGRGSAVRCILNTHTGKAELHTLLDDRAVELPGINGARTGLPHRHSYAAASRISGHKGYGPLQGIVKLTANPVERATAVTVDSYFADNDSYCQEPVFVARKGATAEDDGYVLTLCFRAATQTTDLLVLDARDLKRGPLATVHLQHFLPLGIHGSFTQTYLGSGERFEHDIRLGVSKGLVPVYG